MTKLFGYLLAYLLGLVLLLVLMVLLVVRYQPQWLVAAVNAVQSDVQVSAESIAVSYAPLDLQIGSLDLALPAQQKVALKNLSTQANFSAWWTDAPFWLVEAERADVQLGAGEPTEDESAAAPAESAPIDFLGYLTFTKVRVGELLLRQEGVAAPLLRLQLDAGQELSGQHAQAIKLTATGEAAGTTFELVGTLTRNAQSLGFDLQGGASVQAPSQTPGQAPMQAPMQAKLKLAGELTVGRKPSVLLTGGEVDVLLDADRHRVQQLAGRIGVTEVAGGDGLKLEQLVGQYQAPGWDTPLDFAVDVTGATPDGAWSVDGTLQLGRSKVTLETLSTKVADHWHGKLNLTSQGLPPSLSVLPYVDADLFPLTLATQVQASASELALSELAFESPTNQLSGALSMSLDAPRRATAQLQAQRLYLPLVPPTQAPDNGDAAVPAPIPAPIATAAPADSAPPAEQDAAAPATSVVFAEEPLDWSWLQNLELKVALSALELKLQDAVFTDFDVQLHSSDGQLKLAPFAATIGNGGFSGAVELALADQAAESVTASVALQINDVELESFGFVPQEELQGGALEVDVQLTTGGRSAHDLAAGLDGDMLIIVDEARLMNDFIELAGSDLLMETLNKLNPFRKDDPTTELKCGLVHFAAKQGVLRTSKQLVMETSKMEIIGDGKVDLDKEQLSITFSPVAKSGFGLNVGSLVKFLKLGGRLNDPKPTADAGGLLKSGAAIGAAISTGGLSVVADGIASQALNAGSACAAIRKSRAAAAGPTQVQSQVQSGG